MTKTVLFILLEIFAPAAHAGKIPLMPASPAEKAEVRNAERAEVSPVARARSRHPVGLGISAGGPLSIVGVELDVNVMPELSVGVGYGTGIDYQTLMSKARFFLLESWLAPYVGGGLARWWTGGTKEKRLAPAVLANKFLTSADDPAAGFDAWLLYPCVGLQLLHRTGFAVFAELEYLFRLPALGHGLYAGTGLHWYF